MKYKIIKETKSITKKEKFYVLRKRKFLFWTWWSRVKKYHPLIGALELDFDSQIEAQKCIDRLSDKIIIEEIKGNN